MDRIDAMRLFLRVAELGSFSRAADEADVGQPTVSRRIQELEQQIGAQLFRRTTRALSLTEPGQRFYARAQAIVAEFDEAEAEARGLDREPVGLLRITASNGFARFLLSPHLPAFLEAYPHIRVEILATEKLVDLVEEGVDLAFRFGDLADSSLTARRIGATSRHLYAAPAYLDRRGRPNSPADLMDHDCLLLAPGGQTVRWTLARGDDSHVIEVPGRFRATSADLIRDAVLAGMGVALTPCFLVRPELESGVLEIVLDDWAYAKLPIHAVWPTGRMLPRKARVFLDFIEERIRPVFGD